MKIIVASSIPNFAEAISDMGYTVVSSVTSTNELQRLFGSTEAVGDVLIATERIEIDTPLIYVLKDIHEHFPGVRIIYLTNGDLENKFTVNQLYTLADMGIYDLFYSGKITSSMIKELIENPRLKIDCAPIYEAYKKMDNSATAIMVTEDGRSISEETIRDNVFAVTSVKPGTGKSFVSSNLAVTIARYGKKEDGQKPKVLLLEGDLQTLSVTTLFGIKDD